MRLLVKGSTGLSSNQGEKSINFHFTTAPPRKKALKHGTLVLQSPVYDRFMLSSFGVEECLFGVCPVVGVSLQILSGLFGELQSIALFGV